MNGWSRTEIRAAETEIMKLIGGCVSFDSIMQATRTYAKHVEKTGEEPLPPSVWLRDGHWKKWLN